MNPIETTLIEVDKELKSILDDNVVIKENLALIQTELEDYFAYTSLGYNIVLKEKYFN